jgi:hypothetical protein
MDPIAALLAKQEIVELSHRYAQGIDRADPDAWDSAFTPDAQLHYGIFDLPAAQVSAGMRAGSASPLLITHHLIGNQRVVFDDDTHARTSTYLSAAHRTRLPDGTLQDELVRGRYLDHVVVHAGQWRIADRTLVYDWSQLTPARGRDWWEQPGGTPQVGAHGPADPSHAFFADRPGG